MDLDDIERLLEMFAQAPVAELDLSQDGWRISLTKAGPFPPGTADDGPLAARAEPEAEPAQAEAPSAAHVIVAALTGTFYRAPSPDKPPFVEAGDLVAEGQTIGILDAMKTLIGVPADRAGRIGEIFAADGAPVRAGEPLFALLPVGRP